LPRWYVLAALVLAVAGLGRITPDEHFSILEFLGFKLGLTPWHFLHYPNALSDLPWEFPERIRPFTEVALFYVVAKILSVFTINPVIWEIFFRMIAVGLSLVAMHLLIKRFEDDSRSKSLIVLSVFACGFLPLLYTRLMSEMWGASVLTIGILTYLAAKNPRHIFFAGMLIGTGFWLRYHIGFMIAGFGLWMLFIERASFKSIFLISLGFIAASGINVALDRWGYGVWTFTPWNYFNTGIIQDRASAYGIAPFWYYPVLIWREYGAGTLAAFFVAVIYWIKFPKSVFTWMGFFFFIGHAIVPRKETRFLIPLFFLTPWYLASLAALLESRGFSLKKYLRWAALCGLIYAGGAGLNRGLTRNEMRFYYSYYASPVSREPLHVIGSSPFDWGGYYYRPLGYRENKISSHEDFAKQLDAVPKFLFHNTYAFPAALKPYCSIAVQTVPMWLDTINVNHWVERTSFWQVYSCKKT